MSKLVHHPKCKNCTSPNCYGDRYDGFCLQCHNAGVPELMEQIADRDRQLKELREVCERIKKVCWWLMDAPHEDYQEAVNQFAMKLADAVDIPKHLAALLPPIAKEKNDAE